MYSVKITSRAEGELKRLDRPVKNRVVTAILALASDPRPPGCLKVRSAEGVWRIRVGDWRVGYEIDDSLQEVVVIKDVCINRLTRSQKERGPLWKKERMR